MNTTPRTQSPPQGPRRAMRRPHNRHLLAFLNRPERQPERQPKDDFEDGELLQIIGGAIVLLIAVSALTWGFAHATNAQNQAVTARMEAAIQ